MSSAVRSINRPTDRLRRRRFASYTPSGATGLLVDNDDEARTAESFAAVTGGRAEFDAWRRFYGMVGEVARRLAPTLLELMDLPKPKK